MDKVTAGQFAWDIRTGEQVFVRDLPEGSDTAEVQDEEGFVFRTKVSDLFRTRAQADAAIQERKNQA